MSRFSIGVDLGTTNSVLAFAELSDEESSEVLPAPQIVQPQRRLDILAAVLLDQVEAPLLPPAQALQTVSGLRFPQVGLGQVHSSPQPPRVGRGLVLSWNAVRGWFQGSA